MAANIELAQYVPGFQVVTGALHILLCTRTAHANLPAELHVIGAEVAAGRTLAWKPMSVVEDILDNLRPAEEYLAKDSNSVVKRCLPSLATPDDVNEASYNGLLSQISRYYPTAAVSIENGRLLVTADTSLPARTPGAGFTPASSGSSSPRGPRRAKGGKERINVWI